MKIIKNILNRTKNDDDFETILSHVEIALNNRCHITFKKQISKLFKETYTDTNSIKIGITEENIIYKHDAAQLFSTLLKTEIQEKDLYAGFDRSFEAATQLIWILPTDLGHYYILEGEKDVYFTAASIFRDLYAPLGEQLNLHRNIYGNEGNQYQVWYIYDHKTDEVYAKEWYCTDANIHTRNDYHHSKVGIKHIHPLDKYTSYPEIKQQIDQFIANQQ